ncbi:MAG: rhodanese-like domain-containing protein [Saprospiraceae bacterium]|jgi:phage shock protein E|nr:rhodanese-like domain-containing protein [Saprospiraceae bacterium]
MLNFLKKLFGGGAAANLTELLAQGAFVLDVRSREEFNAGHAAGAQNVPLPDLNRHLLKLANQKKAVITCCVSGRRSGIAAQQLKAAGVEAVNGGAWQIVANAVNEFKKASVAA